MKYAYSDVVYLLSMVIALETALMLVIFLFWILRNMYDTLSVPYDLPLPARQCSSAVGNEVRPDDAVLEHYPGYRRCAHTDALFYNFFAQTSWKSRQIGS